MKQPLSFNKWLASGFGTGFISKMPGTIGSLASFLLIVPTILCGGFRALLVLSFVFALIGWLTIPSILKLGPHDPKWVTIDEFWGQTLTFLTLMPRNYQTWHCYLVGFFLFRLFDIWKPFPVGYLDRKLLNTHGVMLDDGVAAIYAALVLLLYQLIISKAG